MQPGLQKQLLAAESEALSVGDPPVSLCLTGGIERLCWHRFGRASIAQKRCIEAANVVEIIRLRETTGKVVLVSESAMIRAPDSLGFGQAETGASAPSQPSK